MRLAVCRESDGQTDRQGQFTGPRDGDNLHWGGTIRTSADCPTGTIFTSADCPGGHAVCTSANCPGGHSKGGTTDPATPVLSAWYGRMRKYDPLSILL